MNEWVWHLQGSKLTSGLQPPLSQILATTMWNRYHHSHFTDEQRVRKWSNPCFISQSRVKSGFTARSTWLRPQSFHFTLSERNGGIQEVVMRGSAQVPPLGKTGENGVVETRQDWKSRTQDQRSEKSWRVMRGDSRNLSLITQQKVSLASQTPLKTGFSVSKYNSSWSPLGKDKTLTSTWFWMGVHSTFNIPRFKKMVAVEWRKLGWQCLTVFGTALDRLALLDS